MNLKKYLVHIVAVLTIILVNVVYFFPQFQGKELPMGDIQSYKGMSQEAKTYRDKGENVLWTNSMFGGMPTYQIGAEQKNNWSKYYMKVLQLGMDRPAGYFIMGMLCFYLAMILIGISPWVSLVTAVFFGFGTGNLILYEAGHTSKILAIMTSAPIIAGVLLTLRGRLWLGGFVFTLFLAINLYANHPQMTYYLGMTLAILMVIYLIKNIRSNSLAEFAKPVLILVVGALLALGTFASKTLTTLEYSEDTMRGKPILEQTGEQARSSSETDGLEWSYAMNWSNGFIDLLTAWIPKVAGGGSVEMVDKDSNFAKIIGSRKATQAPTYFGSLPSTAGPLYLGVVPFLLFFLGMFIVRERAMKIWIGAAVLLTFLLSLGSNLEWFNRIFFEYFPMYNKFRTPNSVISITGVLTAVGAAIALNALFKSEDKQKLQKPIMTGLGILAGITLLVALIGPYMFSLSGSYDANIGQPQIVDALIEDRMAIMRGSAIRSLIVILIIGGLLWAYLKDKLSGLVFLVIVGLIGLFDLFSVGKDYLNSDDFVSPRQLNTEYQMRPVDRQILEDNTLHYRVHDITTDPFNSSRASYYHKTIGGYHPAKLQRIQDVIERYIATGEQKVLNMLNTRYFIVDNNGTPAAQLNPAALGNAWFVSKIDMVTTANEEIDALGEIDPAMTAVVHNEFSDYVDDLQINKNGSIKLTSYHPEKLTYTAETNSEQLAVFSEIWYGPDKGWTAYIDGEEVPFIRVNYLLRGLKVPAGEHNITFEFHPDSYYLGENISLISSLLILAMGIFVGYRWYRTRTE